MRSISLSMIVAATLLVACNRGKPLPDMSEVSSVPASATPPPPAPPEPAPAQAPVTDATPLYEIDSEAQRAPSPGSGLDRIIKGLHVRVCVRADVAPFASLSVNGLDG